MGSLYYSVDLGNGKHLRLAPMPHDKFVAFAEDIDDESGYFLYEQIGEGPTCEISILAQVHSDEAAVRLSQMFGMS